MAAARPLPATVRPSSSSLPCFFPVLFFAYFLCTDFLGLVAAGDARRNYRVFHADSLKPAPFCSAPPKGLKRKGLPVIHRYGPCSPLGQADISAREFLNRDQARVNWLQTRLSGSSQRVGTQDTTTLPAKLGVDVGTLNYVVTVGLGTPRKSLTLAFDTGSDLTWTQCRPCTGGCYNQRDQIFDPAQSSSYQNISCSSSECASLASGNGNNPVGCTRTAPFTCVYFIGYVDGSRTAGFYASDLLALGSDSVDAFRFGCGIQNNGLFGSVAGILGLGRDEVSVVSQAAQKFSKVFSYCLPSSSSSSSGYLTFGPGASSGAKFTPILTNPNAPSFYFLKLTAIFVAGEQLQVPKSTFSSPGTIIDSGTVISRLPPSAYSALRAAFREKMANYTLTAGSEILDTCYDLSGNGDVSVPQIVLRFDGGVDVDVDLSGILYFVKDTQVCLAFAGNNGTSPFAIIGNLQQRTYEIVYDVAGGKVGFSAGGCD